MHGNTVVMYIFYPETSGHFALGVIQPRAKKVLYVDSLADGIRRDRFFRSMRLFLKWVETENIVEMDDGKPCSIRGPVFYPGRDKHWAVSAEANPSLRVILASLAANSWDFEEYKCPQQIDGTSCGLFAALNAVHICRRDVPMYKVTAANVTKLRCHVFNEMKTGTLLQLPRALLNMGKNHSRECCTRLGVEVPLNALATRRVSRGLSILHLSAGSHSRPSPSSRISSRESVGKKIGTSKVVWRRVGTFKRVECRTT